MKWSERTKIPYDPALARQQVACKIRHVYGLSENDFTMADDVAIPYLKGTNHIITNSTRFAQSRERSIRESNLNAEQVKELDALIPKIFEDYGHGFEVREKVVKALVDNKHPQGFSKAYTRKVIADAYINHISNAAQRALSALGLNTKSAISLHGMIIEAALSCRYGGEIVNGEVQLTIPGDISLGYVEPAQAPENRPTPAQAVKELDFYWRQCGRAVNQSCYPNR